MRQEWPAAARNSEPILNVLRRVLPDPGLTLEIASGTGQHAAYMTEALPGVRWQASDRESTAVQSIAAWREETRRDNFLAPVLLDVCDEQWPIREADSIFCANMVHISPWRSCLGLLLGASRVLGPGGILVLYGPYRVSGVPTAPSNEAFDRSLRARDPEWGLRKLEDVRAAALERGLVFDEQIEMPANNLSLVFRRT